MHFIAKCLVVLAAAILGLATSGHVRRRFEFGLLASLLVFAVAGCSSVRTIPASIVDGGVNTQGVKIAQCAVTRGPVIVLTEESCND